MCTMADAHLDAARIWQIAQQSVGRAARQQKEGDGVFDNEQDSAHRSSSSVVRPSQLYLARNQECSVKPENDRLLLLRRSVPLLPQFHQ